MSKQANLMLNTMKLYLPTSGVQWRDFVMRKIVPQDVVVVDAAVRACVPRVNKTANVTDVASFYSIK